MYICSISIYRENTVENDKQTYTLKFQKIITYVHRDFKFAKRTFLGLPKMISFEF